jgi:hypothetical protein
MCKQRHMKRLVQGFPPALMSTCYAGDERSTVARRGNKHLHYVLLPGNNHHQHTPGVQLHRTNGQDGVSPLSHNAIHDARKEGVATEQNHAPSACTLCYEYHSKAGHKASNHLPPAIYMLPPAIHVSPPAHVALQHSNEVCSYKKNSLEVHC